MNENKPNEVALKPAAELIINKPETLKVIADPARLRIMDLLIAEPRTVKQLAAALGVALSKMYYHINLLEEHGLIRVVSTRMVSNLMEKLYQASAYSFNVDKSLLTFNDTEISEGEAMLNTVFDLAKSEIKQSVMAGLIETSADAPIHRTVMLNMAGARLRPEQAEEFYARLKVLLEEFGTPEASADDPTAANYALLLALFPAKPDPTPDPHETEYG